MSFDPISIAIIGAVVGAAGSVMSGMAEASAANQRAKIAEMNKTVALENADRAIDRSQTQAFDQDMLTLAMLGDQENVQGASGLTGRSQILARKTARELGRKDALNIRQGGEVEAYNYKVEASNQGANASLYRQQAGFSLLSGFVGAAKSLIGGASSVKSPSKFGSTFTPSGLRKPVSIAT